MGTEIIKALEQETERANSIYRALRNRLDKLNDKEQLPILKKKYEGKYFKYKDSFGTNEYWWAYFKCIKVNGIYNYRANAFQSIPGKNEFEINRHLSGPIMFQTEITRNEYKRALKKFKSKLRLL